jgi:hypothetical protein
MGHCTMCTRQTRLGELTESDHFPGTYMLRRLHHMGITEDTKVGGDMMGHCEGCCHQWFDRDKRVITCPGCGHEAEIERLTGLLMGACCVYCGFISAPDVPNQEIGYEILKAHIATCEKHPLTQMRRERDVTLAEVERLKQQVDNAERAEKEAIADFKEQFSRAEMLTAERDALRKDLKVVAETLECIHRASPSWSIDFANCGEALSRPGVQQIMQNTP